MTLTLRLQNRSNRKMSPFKKGMLEIGNLNKRLPCWTLAEGVEFYHAPSPPKKKWNTKWDAECWCKQFVELETGSQRWWPFPSSLGQIKLPNTLGNAKPPTTQLEQIHHTVWGRKNWNIRCGTTKYWIYIHLSKMQYIRSFFILHKFKCWIKYTYITI